MCPMNVCWMKAQGKSITNGQRPLGLVVLGGPNILKSLPKEGGIWGQGLDVEIQGEALE